MKKKKEKIDIELIYSTKYLRIFKRNKSGEILVKQTKKKKANT